ncbi:extracellular solute-binding protein [Bradyrhizobium sp. Arg62]|uniref:extracellular solute-binding protein n=1 Tax=Bradyrhizobium brasilense TaxID=1419277 RepID=UPI001E5F33DE|nr:extracellular solute-binding protein [Bradyrhizobium brasilense]MCC8944222.1 extracellular solute-binding protein [Bradyrhizobium brasilense]
MTRTFQCSFREVATMKGRTILASAGAAAVGGTLDFAFGGIAAPAQGREPIEVSFFDSAFQPVMQALIDTFQEQAPQIEIRMQAPAQTWDVQLQRTILDIRTGTAAELAVQRYNRLKIVAAKKAAVPLNALIAKESDWAWQGYSPTLMSSSELHDQQRGLPLQLSNPIIFYNADLFREADSDPQNPSRRLGWRDRGREERHRVWRRQDEAFFDYTTDGNWMYQAPLFSERRRAEGRAGRRAECHAHRCRGPSAQGLMISYVYP